MSLDWQRKSSINLRWYRKLLTAPRLFICMDVDEAGEKAAAEMMALSRAAISLQIPVGEDMNEFYLRLGHSLASEWLQQIVEYKT